MGNVGRSCYLFIPFALTIISLILLLIVLLNLTNGTSNSFLESLYFIRVDASNIQASVGGHSVSVKGILGFYDIGLFRYCSGAAGASMPNKCSGSQLGFAFNITDVLGNANIANVLESQDLKDAFNTYQTLSKVISATYIIAFIGLALSAILGLLTFCLSRVTNCLTTIVALIGTLSLGVASAAATGTFVTIKGAVYAKLHQYNVTADVGTRVLIITWIATAIAVAATFLWSCGCCCGRDRSDSRGDFKRANSLHARSAYERVPSPMLGNNTAYNNYMGPAVPLNQYNGTTHGYEPYRHDSHV